MNANSQFHQHFTLAFFVRKCFAQLSLVTFQLCNFWRKNIGAKISVQKYRRKNIGAKISVQNLRAITVDEIDTYSMYQN